jgi:hypothetical protein
MSLASFSRTDQSKRSYSRQRSTGGGEERTPGHVGLSACHP